MAAISSRNKTASIPSKWTGRISVFSLSVDQSFFRNRVRISITLVFLSSEVFPLGSNSTMHSGGNTYIDRVLLA